MSNILNKSQKPDFICNYLKNIWTS